MQQSKAPVNRANLRFQPIFGQNPTLFVRLIVSSAINNIDYEVRRFSPANANDDCSQQPLDKGTFAGDDFARERQALTAFHLAAQLGIGLHRTIALRRPRRGTDLVFTKGIADANDHNREPRVGVAKRYH